MHKFTLLIFLTIIGAQIIYSQNLVSNPSFEDYNKCPWIIGKFSGNVNYWSTPNLGTTDFFSTCSKSVGINNYNGYQSPKDGHTYAGFYLFSPDDYREYIQGRFTKQLEAGKRYRIKFHISLADKSTHTLKTISVLFTENLLGFVKLKSENNNSILTSKSSNYNVYRHISKKYIKPNKYTKGEFQLNDIASKSFYDDKVNWIEISTEFTANGFENYFTIGNFKPNNKTTKRELLRTTKVKHQFSYYYIDNISVELLKKEEVKEPEAIEERPTPEVIKTNTVYIFKNVLFNFDKAELLDISVKELNQLYQYLNNNLDLSIEIYGHTDNIGTQKRNEELSHQRAKAVADYLILQGLDKARIKSFGFGSSKSISGNETEQGRQQNRRVEFKIIDD
ncbi:OmpA family protein [Winogradskyella immobilis]|uniref:OmpA family protein n=1 Tax=Winogradskyella immobilis TaxID=2816852 RepID=A0ABS8EKK2_9FLAO|nr:OmpA family protein [Winogradskyella immobilis]MCC1483367.1 OmpA family protein [Winogradskyella immobilis]MCG0015461.1 OmpA family protein [Winogradskyella immobilis]